MKHHVLNVHGALRVAVSAALALAGCASDTLNRVAWGDEAPGDCDLACGDGALPGGDDNLLPTGDDIPPADADLPEPCKFYGVDRTSSLWVIDPTVPSARLVGDTGVASLTDIAIMADGRMYAHSTSGLYRLSPTTAAATAVIEDDSEIIAFRPVAADGLRTGSLIVGGRRSLGLIDTSDGSVTDLGVYLPDDWEFAGDIAAAAGSGVYATAKSPGQPDHLFYFDTSTHLIDDRGSLGTDMVWGLDFGCDGELYGLVNTSPLGLIHVDPATVTVTQLGTVTGPTSLWGAAGPATQ